VISQVVLVDHAVMYKVPSLALAVMVLLSAGVVFGCVMVIVGAVLSKVYVYAFGLILALPAASHAATVNVVVLYNVVLLRVAAQHDGLVRFVVYFMVPSLALQVTATPDGPKVEVPGVQVGGGGTVVSIHPIAGVELRYPVFPTASTAL